jgi:hypothetical protein
MGKSPNAQTRKQSTTINIVRIVKQMAKTHLVKGVRDFLLAI